MERLRESACVETIHADVVLEVAALVIVEGEVEVARAARAEIVAIYEARLVEGGTGFVDIVKFLAVGLHVEASAQRNLTAAEHTDTCWIGVDDGDVCAEGVHGTTHTNKACRSVEVVVGECLHFIDILGQ